MAHYIIEIIEGDGVVECGATRNGAPSGLWTVQTLPQALAAAHTHILNRGERDELDHTLGHDTLDSAVAHDTSEPEPDENGTRHWIW